MVEQRAGLPESIVLGIAESFRRRMAVDHQTVEVQIHGGLLRPGACPCGRQMWRGIA
jgi:hypothetical protein